MRTRVPVSILIVLLIAGGILILGRCRETARLEFVRMPLPEGTTGDCKAAGDLDGDGFLDLVVGGKGSAEPLVWYQQRTWVARRVAVSEEEFSNDCAVADVNRDGFLDIVVPDATIEPDNLLWFENPGPAAILTSPGWKRHSIGHTTAWCKDVRVIDVDADGYLDVVARPQFLPPVVFFQAEDGTWARVALDATEVGREGMAAGDLDGDGDQDLIIRGGWLENPGGARARLAAEWTAHSIGEAPEDFKAFVADVDADGSQDVLFSNSEGEGPIVSWGRTEAGSDHWVGRVVADRAQAAHTLWAADLDLDGDQDVLAAEIWERRITWHQNSDGDAKRWEAEAIDTEQGSIHNGLVADLDRDGDLDVFGAGFTGQDRTAAIWWNQLNPERLPIGPFTGIEVTHEHARAFGLVIVDIDRDGLEDIAAGPYWYRNPGGDLGKPWGQESFPRAAGQMIDLIASVPDENGEPILLAMTPDSHLWSLKRDAGRFQPERVGRLPEADHGISTQGVAVAPLLPGGAPELIVSNGGDAATGVGIYAFRAVPEGPWPRRRITSRTSDEGIAVGDIDRDGDLDVAGTRGDLGEVEWYENPGDSGEDWPAHRIAKLPDIRWLDRIRAADLNCDGRLDFVVTEENGAAESAETFWLEQPADPAQGDWSAHLVTSQGSTNSLDLADFDRDGDVDIVIGEHQGELRVTVWENTHCGEFEMHPVARGVESHLGTKAADLDHDGDFDLISIAWDRPGRLYLWRNDAVRTRSDRSDDESTSR